MAGHEPARNKGAWPCAIAVEPGAYCVGFFPVSANGHGHERGLKIDAVLVPDCTPAGAVAERSVSRIRLRPIVVVPISGRRIDRPSFEGVVHLLDRGRLAE